jgi:hypothetical protein
MELKGGVVIKYYKKTFLTTNFHNFVYQTLSTLPSLNERLALWQYQARNWQDCV